MRNEKVVKAIVGVVLIALGLLLPKIVLAFTSLETVPPTSWSFRAVDANGAEITDAKLYKIYPISIYPYYDQVFLSNIPATLGVEEVLMYNSTTRALGIKAVWRGEEIPYTPSTFQLGQTITYNFTGTISGMPGNQMPTPYNWMVYAQLIMIIAGFVVFALPRKAQKAK